MRRFANADPSATAHPHHDATIAKETTAVRERLGFLGVISLNSRVTILIGFDDKEEPMPIHAWSRVPAGLFHHFHQQWSSVICNALNAGRLPKGYYALIEQTAGGVVPDVLTLGRRPRVGARRDAPTGITVATIAPKTRFVSQATEDEVYAAKANRIAIRHHLGDVVAVIEIVSPGNKSSRHALKAFLNKTLEFLQEGIHLLIIDLFPPSTRDPQGIHKAIWDELGDEPFELPADKRLTLVAYSAGIPKKAYVEPVAAGDALPDMPIFLDPDTYILAPLEAAYLATWESCPEEFREAIPALDQ
jgi:uncharacterized protein DUF4058